MTNLVVVLFVTEIVPVVLLIVVELAVVVWLVVLVESIVGFIVVEFVFVLAVDVVEFIFGLVVELEFKELDESSTHGLLTRIEVKKLPLTHVFGNNLHSNSSLLQEA